jgi:hypothetical protein
MSFTAQDTPKNDVTATGASKTKYKTTSELKDTSRVLNMPRLNLNNAATIQETP